MCALVNPIGYEHNCMYGGNESIESFLQFPLPQEEILLDSQSPSINKTSFDPCVVKKLNHNASERDRRKKVNTLYSSLSSLLPASDQMKKLSFPATVSRAMKYIPELQEQVERLAQKKEELLLRISQQGGLKRKSRIGRCLNATASISINRLRTDSDEVAIQISMEKVVHNKTQLAEMLHYLEQQGFLLLNATSFESFEGMVFYNIHLQLETTYELESDHDALSEKLLTFCVSKEEFIIN
ncbi:transcription factor ORG2-like [Durio zibethinus]|uniref:Transcription factor ORG2-like n=1 Tax=Durio zibethinus TaxID=66656 RepID=A0A6P5ZLC3_DURZI|nr:transcription factor ORG2-like [Durio zibethinus]